MAELANKFRLKKDGVEHECTCYTIEEEATPTTIPGGSAWEIKNNGVVCYIGLWPTSESGGEFHTPLRLKKNGVEYYIETKVLNNFTVNIVQSENQTIQVTYNGQVYTSTFEVMAGSQISVEVIPLTGYTAGAPSITSGYVNNNLTITASPASKNTYLFTINQSDNQTIQVTCNGVVYTSTFSAGYGDTWTALVIPNEGYNAGTLDKTSGTITGTVSISATEAEIKKYPINVTQPENAIITVNGNEGTIFTINHGTSVTIEAIPDDLYKIDALYVSETEI